MTDLPVTPTAAPVVVANDHDFRHAAVDAVHDSPRQREIRKIAPMPFGAVLIARDDMDEDTVRAHLRAMKDLGFNSIKQFMGCDRWPSDQLERMAHDEGLVAWWYGEGGWEPITDELCTKLGIDPALSIAEQREHPAMIEHQRGVLAQRFGRPKLKLNPEAQVGMFDEKKHGGRIARAYGTDANLPEWAMDEFRAWLVEQYDNDIAKLNAAWNVDGSYAKDPTSGYESFEAVPFEAASNKREYRRVRDVLRFKADIKNRDVRATGEQGIARDPHEPHRSGGEMGLFLPFASRGTDMQGIAEAMKDYGSFYPSIHLCWHFEETFFEVARPVYMQASFVCDLNKGGWTAPWESTGGPQQTSGSNAPLFAPARDRQPGYTVDAGVMTQLLLSYLAAGCRGAGLWSWNARLAGVEAGEYALLDRNEQICDRTRRVGKIAQAANRYRDELWAAHKEPTVGVVMDWNNEAIWAAMSEFNRSVFKHFPIEARIGASRTCQDAQLPFEYVTASDLLEHDLASRYPVLYLPGFLALDRALLPIFKTYVENGGRLVVDMPCGGYDETGRVLFTNQGTDFEQLFGVELSDLQYSGNNVVWHLDDAPIHGYVADLVPTTATVAKRYRNGRPAITEHQIGAGSAVILGWEAARTCYRPGQDAWQERLANWLRGDVVTAFAAEGHPQVYRMAAPEADHYFVINSGDPSASKLTRVPFAYSEAVDAITGEAVDLAEPIAVGADDGRWIRCTKA